MTNKSKSVTHIDSLPAKVKIGFTLAETLITLGIIGIVAALTIPNLITNYQKHVTVTKLQKAISVLNQAYKMSFDDVGEPSTSESFAMGGDAYFNKYWAPYIKTAIICKTYQQCGYKRINPWLGANHAVSNTAVVASNERTTFYTSDGFLYIIFTSQGGSKLGEHVKNSQVYVDINGGEGPNVYGRDLFVLARVEEEGGGIQPYGYKSTAEDVDKQCSKDTFGMFCAEKIRRAGWKIEKDYPW